MSVIRIFTERRELVSNLVARELKSKYKGSVLGVLWSVLTPLFMAVIYVVFLSLLARGVPIEQIVIGVFAWQFTVQSVNGGMNAITGNANLVKKVFFPRIILPVSITLANLVDFLLSLVVQFVLVGLLLLSGGAFFPATVVIVPVLILYHTLFNTSLALLMSSANVYFRDTQHLVGVLLSAWFFVSPVMYHLDFVKAIAGTKPWVMNLYMLNPLAALVTGYRALTLPGVAFPWSAYSIIGLAWPLLLAPVAYVVYQRSQRYFSDML